jgi:hypothetical protein
MQGNAMRLFLVVFTCLSLFLGNQDTAFASASVSEIEPVIILSEPLSSYGKTPEEILRELEKLDQGEEVGSASFSQCLISKARAAKNFMQGKIKNLYDSLPTAGTVKVYIEGKTKELSVLAARKIVEDLQKNGLKRMIQATCYLSGTPIPEELSFAWNVVVVEETLKKP